MLPVVQFSFAIFYPTIFRMLRFLGGGNACLQTVEVTLQKPLVGGLGSMTASNFPGY